MVIIPVNLEAADIEFIAASYNKKVQTVKAIEELAELQQALSKIYLANESNSNYAERSLLLKHVTEEMADVLIMLNQMISLHSIQFNELCEMFDYKVKRQIRRIKGEEE